MEDIEIQNRIKEIEEYIKSNCNSKCVAYYDLWLNDDQSIEDEVLDIEFGSLYTKSRYPETLCL